MHEILFWGLEPSFPKNSDCKGAAKKTGPWWFGGGTTIFKGVFINSCQTLKKKPKKREVFLGPPFGGFFLVLAQKGSLFSPELLWFPKTPQPQGGGEETWDEKHVGKKRKKEGDGAAKRGRGSRVGPSRPKGGAPAPCPPGAGAGEISSNPKGGPKFKKTCLISHI